MENVMEQEKKEPTLCEIIMGFEKTMQCNCDLDNWEPEKLTGHSHVCRIHNAAIRLLRESK